MTVEDQRRYATAGIYAGWALATNGKWGQPEPEDIEDYVLDILEDVEAWED